MFLRSPGQRVADTEQKTLTMSFHPLGGYWLTSCLWTFQACPTKVLCVCVLFFFWGGTVAQLSYLCLQCQFWAPTVTPRYHYEGHDRDLIPSLKRGPLGSFGEGSKEGI